MERSGYRQQRERQHLPNAGVRDDPGSAAEQAGSAAGRERARGARAATRRPGAVRAALGRTTEGVAPPARRSAASRTTTCPDVDRAPARGRASTALHLEPRGARRTWRRSSRAAVEIAPPRRAGRGRARAVAPRGLERARRDATWPPPSAARSCPRARWRTTRRRSWPRCGARSRACGRSSQSVMESYLRGKDAERAPAGQARHHAQRPLRPAAEGRAPRPGARASSTAAPARARASSSSPCPRSS